MGCVEDAEGDLGAPLCVDDVGEDLWISVESSESECDEDADCDLRPRLFNGGGTERPPAALEAGGGYS